MDRQIRVKKKDVWKYSTFALVLAVFIVGFFIFRSSDSQQGVNPKSLIESNDPLLGDANAEITIVEFSDFQCIFCAKAFEGTVTDFKNSDYFKSGKVNLIYKQMPLDNSCNTNLKRQLHPNACKAAEASLCADEQDKFWEMHDLLFSNQNALEVDNLKAYATQLNLNSNKFGECLDSGKFDSEIKKEILQASSIGGSGTPFFVVINKKTGNFATMSGAYPFESGTHQITLEDKIKEVM